MNKLKTILMMASVIGQMAYASTELSQINSARDFQIALDSNQEIQRYVRGLSEPTPELLIEILNFVQQADCRTGGINLKCTSTLQLAEEVGNQLTKLGPETRENLSPVIQSLLQQYPHGAKTSIIMRMLDRFWLWSPVHLEFLAAKVRADNSHLVSTQLMWVLEKATPGERRIFFAHVPSRKPNKQIRWFSYALAHKYGKTVDMRDFRSTLRLANPERLRPAPLPLTLGGKPLPTTEDLYWEVKDEVLGGYESERCTDTILAGS